MVVSSNTRPLSKYQLKKRQKCVLRTLENLPMKYNYKDSLRLAHSCRSVRTVNMEEENLARRISENQTSQSRRLFEQVLNRNENGIALSTLNQRAARSAPPVTMQGEYSRHTIRMPPSLSHTGPTRYGSPIYRRPPPIDEGYYQRSTSPVHLQAPPRYFRAPPMIEKTLQRSMSTYKVVKSNNGHEFGEGVDTKHGSSFPNFILVPNPDRDMDNSDLSVDENEDVSFRNYSFLGWKKNLARNKMSSMFPEPDNMNLSENYETQTEKVIQGAATQLQAIENVKKQLSPRSSNGSNKSVKSTAGEQLPTDQNKQDVINTCNPEERERSADKPLEPKDTTVTTDKSTLQRRSTQSKLKSKKGKKDKKGKDTDVSSSSITEEQSGPKLPMYICPSSEEKSKESRIRHWLRETTFTNANRHVPLV